MLETTAIEIMEREGMTKFPLMRQAQEQGHGPELSRS